MRLKPIFKVIRRTMFKNLICLVLLLASGLWGIKALFHQGFYTSHDGRHQVIRLMHFHQGLVDGQMPVRWAGTAFGGYGYPLFIFTYRLPFWLAEAWYRISPSLTDAIKFSFALGYLLSGLTMFWLAKKIWRSNLAGFLSAFVYLWALYRFSNIFVRASLGEATTFMFIPLVYLSFFALNQKKKNNFLWIMLGSLSLAGIILSHAMTLALWLIPLGLWFFLHLYLSKHKRAYFFSSLLVMVLSLLLTCYYWLPAFLEKKHTIFNSALSSYYQTHFVALSQLIYSKWGFGFDFLGTQDDMMSFQIGISQWLIIVLAAPVLLIKIFFKEKGLSKKFALPFYFLIIFILSLYLMLPSSAWFYEAVKKVMIIDLPWRFLGVAVFSASVLGGSLIKFIKNSSLKILIITFLVGVAIYTNRNHLKVNQYTYFPNAEYWQDQETSNQYDDYAPLWFTKPFLDREIQLITQTGESENTLLKRTSNTFVFKSEVQSPQAEISTRISYWPGWETFVDNQKISTSYQEDGRIKIILNQGNHLVELVFKETKLRRLANWLSFLTLLILFSLSARFLFKNAKKK